MAKAKTASKLFGAIAGAALAATAVLSSTASAEETTNASSDLSAAWTDETRELHASALAARNYAENNYGVGVLIHVVENNFPNQHFATPDQFGQAIVGVFNNNYGVQAEYFLSRNEGARATGITYHIDDLIHGSDNGTEVKNVQEALESMADVVEALRIAKEEDLAQANTLPSAEPGS